MALITLLACTPQESTVIAQPGGDISPAEDICDRTICDAGSECADGQCICKQDFKACGSTCIPATHCCSDTDCEANRACQQGTCAVIEKECAYNQQFDHDTGECTCAPDTQFCESQQKCIVLKSCCSSTDCQDRDEKCSPTSFAATVCITDPLLHCKSIRESHQEIFGLQGGALTVGLDTIQSDGSVNVSVNGASVPAKIKREVSLEKNRKLVIDAIKTFGGTCKDDE